MTDLIIASHRAAFLGEWRCTWNWIKPWISSPFSGLSWVRNIMNPTSINSFSAKTPSSSSSSCIRTCQHPSKMGDYYRRDRYDDDRRYYRDDNDRRYDRYNDRDDRYPPPHRRSPDLYYDRDRERGDHSYREREKDRSWERDRDDRERYQDYPPRDLSRSEGREEVVERSRSPPEERDIELQHPPKGPRSERHRGHHDDPFDAGKPNSHVIFRGLDKDIAETHVSEFLLPRSITNFRSCNNFFTIKALQLNLWSSSEIKKHVWHIQNSHTCPFELSLTLLKENLADSLSSNSSQRKLPRITWRNTIPSLWWVKIKSRLPIVLAEARKIMAGLVTRLNW